MVDLNSFHLESAFSREKNTFANPMFNFRELSRHIILHTYLHQIRVQYRMHIQVQYIVNIQCGSLVDAGDLHQVGEVKNIVRHTWEHMKRPLGRATRLSRRLSRTFAKLSQKPVIALDKLKCKNICFWLPRYIVDRSFGKEWT